MREYLTTAKTFEFNWGITIPSDLKEEYHINTEPSFGGDGERYSIFNGSEFIMDFNSNQDYFVFYKDETGKQRKVLKNDIRVRVEVEK